MPGWHKLARLPWICATSSTCCGRATEGVFERNGFRPKKLVSVDQENVTRTLIAEGVGIDLLHADTAWEAERMGEVELIGGPQQAERLIFSYQCRRAHDQLIEAVSAAVREILVERPDDELASTRYEIGDGEQTTCPNRLLTGRLGQGRARSTGTVASCGERRPSVPAQRRSHPLTIQSCRSRRPSCLPRSLLSRVDRMTWRS
ncbi:MAG: substrate-binding domain-containing protein [Nitrospiraceae bacterium]